MWSHPIHDIILILLNYYLANGPTIGYRLLGIHPPKYQTNRPSIPTNHEGSTKSLLTVSPAVMTVWNTLQRLYRFTHKLWFHPLLPGGLITPSCLCPSALTYFLWYVARRSLRGLYKAPSYTACTSLRAYERPQPVMRSTLVAGTHPFCAGGSGPTHSGCTVHHSY